MLVGSNWQLKFATCFWMFLNCRCLFELWMHHCSRCSCRYAKCKAFISKIGMWETPETVPWPPKQVVNTQTVQDLHLQDEATIFLNLPGGVFNIELSIRIYWPIKTWCHIREQCRNHLQTLLQSDQQVVVSKPTTATPTAIKHLFASNHLRYKRPWVDALDAIIYTLTN